MWSLFICASILSNALTTSNRISKSMFRDEQIIFSSGFNITKILVPADGNKYINADSSDMPSIFFTAVDSKMEGGTCIYVLEGFAAYEVLEGGTDSSADYGIDSTVYFGAKDGLYKYDPDSLSARKFSPFRDDIIQLQKANGTDAIYILNKEQRIYKIENNGTVKTRVSNIVCALQFVLDTSNNIYYISCDDKMLHIVKSDGSVFSLAASVIEDFEEIKLLRPAFIMDDCVPFFGDGKLYILYSNGTSEKKDFFMKEKPSAISVDAALYLVAALDGRIYEFNVMEVLLSSMFGVAAEWPKDMTNIIMSIMESTREGIFGFIKDFKGYSSVFDQK